MKGTPRHCWLHPRAVRSDVLDLPTRHLEVLDGPTDAVALDGPPLASRKQEALPALRGRMPPGVSRPAVFAARGSVNRI